MTENPVGATRHLTASVFLSILLFFPFVSSLRKVFIFHPRVSNEKFTPPPRKKNPAHCGVEFPRRQNLFSPFSKLSSHQNFAETVLALSTPNLGDKPQRSIRFSRVFDVNDKRRMRKMRAREHTHAGTGTYAHTHARTTTVAEENTNAHMHKNTCRHTRMRAPARASTQTDAHKRARVRGRKYMRIMSARMQQQRHDMHTQKHA